MRDLFADLDIHAEALALIEADARAAHAALDATFPAFVRQRWEDLTEQARDAFMVRAFEAIREGYCVQNSITSR